MNGEAVAALAQELGGGCLPLKGDISDPLVVAGMISTIETHWLGRLDLLVNSADLLWSGNFEDQNQANVATILAVNNAGLALCTHAAFPLLRRSAEAGGRPVVVNMSSASAVFGTPSLAVYSASKFWVRGFTEALAVEWARHGIAVRDVMPSFVDTPMVRDGLQANRIRGKMGTNLTADQVAEEVCAAVSGGPLHRLVTVKLKILALLSRFLPAGLFRWRLAALGGYPLTGATMPYTKSR